MFVETLLAKLPAEKTEASLTDNEIEFPKSSSEPPYDLAQRKFSSASINTLTSTLQLLDISRSSEVFQKYFSPCTFLSMSFHVIPLSKLYKRFTALSNATPAQVISIESQTE